MPVNELLLMLFAFLTSLLTAVMGLGGGLILIALMPGLLPPLAIIPVHAATQLVSNASRALFAWRDIHWIVVTPFLIGSITGGLLSTRIAALINLDYLPLLIAAFILFNVWGGGINFQTNPKGEFLTIGLIQTGMGMLAGATGPLGQSTLLRKGLVRDAMVATSAVFMSITHLVKLAFFGLLGFSFASYWPVTLAMMGAVIAGTWTGTRLRHRVPDARFKVVVKWLLTLLALRIVVQVLLARLDG
ncbi:MAG TPA: sulfite exporter TauE/SafE family protein [Thiolinea sp.]|nr:sulfite exporter TauE/SafE family protein [Thiolinea sp.]